MSATKSEADGAKGGLLDGAQARNEELAAIGRKLGLAIYVILKSASLYDVNNRFWDRPLTSLEEVLRWHFGENVGRPLVLASIEKALFLNGTLVRLDAGTYGAMRFVSRAFDQLEIEDLRFSTLLALDDLRPMVTLFRDAIRSKSGTPLVESTLPGIRFSRRAAKDKEEHDVDKIDPKLAAVTAFASATATAAEFRGLFLAGGNPSLVRLKRAAQELVTTALKHPDLLVGLTQLPRIRGTAAGHMVNTASFSLLLSRKLELPRRSYGELALNAMLAPLGVAEGTQRATVSASFPGEYVAASPEAVAAGGDATARMSAAVSMMKRYGAMARQALVRTAIVHERALSQNASPSPSTSSSTSTSRTTQDSTELHGRVYRLGMKPHLFSRVIAVAAAYDLACQDALPDEALRRVAAQARSNALDNDVVALLSEVLGLYPVGSTVKLSDGTTGVVVQAPRDPKMRAAPVVRILQGAGGRLVDLGAPGARTRIVSTMAPEPQQINVAHCFLL